MEAKERERLEEIKSEEVKVKVNEIKNIKCSKCKKENLNEYFICPIDYTYCTECQFNYTDTALCNWTRRTTHKEHVHERYPKK